MDIMDRLKGPRRNLPIGIQSFERLRRDGYLYVDKTHLSTNLPQRAIRISLAVRVVLAKVCCFLR